MNVIWQIHKFVCVHNVGIIIKNKELLKCAIITLEVLYKVVKENSKNDKYDQCHIFIDKHFFCRQKVNYNVKF